MDHKIRSISDCLVEDLHKSIHPHFFILAEAKVANQDFEVFT